MLEPPPDEPEDPDDPEEPEEPDEPPEGLGMPEGVLEEEDCC